MEHALSCALTDDSTLTEQALLYQIRKSAVGTRQIQFLVFPKSHTDTQPLQ